MRYISILGSTGSIGTQTLSVAQANRDKFSVCAIAAYSNDKLLEEQIERFKPGLAVLVDKAAALRLQKRYNGATKILAGEEGLLAAATYNKADIVLTSLVGFAGLRPTVAAIEAGKDIALANKETLVAAGKLVTSLAKQKNVKILPVDSEHSAILQSLQGENRNRVRRIILTASGGPFRGKSKEELKTVSVEDCLRHPNWSMGKKITVDSATLVNKGLEVIEAKWLYGVEYEEIDVVVHPQSIIHSMVEYQDGAVMAQLGQPDMRVPIQYALTFPDRAPSEFPRLNFDKLSGLTFEKPDTVTFPALTLAYEAGKIGGTLPCVFNAANEIAVYAFLRGEIQFLDIIDSIRHTMKQHQVIKEPVLEEIFTADSWARSYTEEYLKSIK
ncbi:MAG: 1-deoxy-D-xylulose-5-phosphate reductoisomerase [Pelosinus sp.]|nr:1-deoxy-D-xylulose-5-phosphate reductoisomerase [Pelosinus sp.]